VLLTRTWGLHYDEVSYFHLAIHSHLGDTPTSGKPYVFYLFNNALYHLFRRSAGWLHPLILPVFYVILTVLAIWKLAVSASRTGARRGWTFALLLLSPFALFNATQLMMETALLPLLSVTFALLLSMIDDQQRPHAALWLGMAAAVSAVVKDTAVAALLVMGVAFLPVLRYRIWPLLAGSLAGVLGNRFLLWAIYAPPQFHYGGGSQFLASFSDPRQWKSIPAYLGMWLFFLGFAWIGALWSCWERRDRISRMLVALSSLSAAGVLLVQFATVPGLPFPRYAYPVIWVGLASSAIACARSRKAWLAAAVLALQLPWITGLWPGTFPTIRYWPRLVTGEAYSSGVTVLSGAPNYGWIVMSPRALSDLCVYLPRSNAAGVIQAEDWFRDIAEHVTFFDEQQLGAFEQCPGAKAVVDRRFAVDSCETDRCAPASYRVRSCLKQYIRLYSIHTGEIESRVCLP
jgi:hypothetical protein